ncbi:hypothetical protein C5167_002710 [Papaver somniferum]|uniref:Uncharacterized protein n=1 Tax=Papaver somniferum TaxID=3469 RepID=A0A4Y7L1L4_PAPSO|nr:hypothetical protein C5167_002710 [Papaver somniferum]
MLRNINVLDMAQVWQGKVSRDTALLMSTRNLLSCGLEKLLKQPLLRG